MKKNERLAEEAEDDDNPKKGATVGAGDPERGGRVHGLARVVVCTVAIMGPVCTGPLRGPGSGRQRQLTAGCR